jgi:hypothetical protein
MKTKILIPLLLIVLVGCSEPIKDRDKMDENIPKTASSLDEMSIVVIDSCEYIQFYCYAHFSITHKGNCKLCIERSKRK